MKTDKIMFAAGVAAGAMVGILLYDAIIYDLLRSFICSL